MYYGVILLVVALGVAGTWVSRNNRLAQINAAGNSTPPAVGSTENAAFAVDICGKIQPNIKTNKDPVGITTQGDGIIHIHPYKASAAGKNATLGLFARSIGMKLDPNELQVPGGHLYQDGDKCNGVASYVYVRQFAYPGDTVGTLVNGDPRNVHLSDGNEYTIAFLPSSDKNKIPPPPASVVKTLTTLMAQAQASSTTTAPSASTPSSSTPPASSSTTAPTTTAPAKSTPATTAPSPTTTAKK